MTVIIRGRVDMKYRMKQAHGQGNNVKRIVTVRYKCAIYEMNIDINEHEHYLVICENRERPIFKFYAISNYS